MPPRMPNHDPYALRHPIRIPGTPETGSVPLYTLEGDILDMIDAVPPVDDPEASGYDEAYGDAYYATHNYIVDCAARYAAERPDNFNMLVGEISSDASAAEAMAEDDPDRERLERRVQIKAEALVPVTREAVAADPNMTITVEECRQTIRGIVDRVAAFSREHEVKGERALLQAVGELQQYAALNLGPVIQQSIDTAINEAAALYEKTRGMRTGLLEKSHAADDAARRAAREAGPVTPPEDNSLKARVGRRLTDVGRAIDLAAAGQTGRKVVQLKYDDRDSDREKAHAKYVKGLEANSHAQAAVAQRNHQLAMFERRKHELAVRHDEQGLDALINLRKILIDPSGDIVVEHAYTPAAGITETQMIEELKTASANRVTSATSEVDPVIIATTQAELRASVEQDGIWNDVGAGPDIALGLEFARVDRLYREIDMLDEQLEVLTQRAHSHVPAERVAARLGYTQLMVRRQVTLRTYNQAAAHYGQHSVEGAPRNPEGQPDLGGRLPIQVIEDGGVLFGDAEYGAVYWQNGDNALVAEKGRVNGVFEALVNMPDGTMVNHGRFVRFSPDGEVRGNWPEPYPSASQLRQKNSERLRNRSLYNGFGPDAYTRAEALAQNAATRREHLFTNPEIPSVAEEFIDLIDPVTGIQLDIVRNGLADSRMYNYLNYGRIHGAMLANRDARVAAGAPPEEITALDDRITTFEAERVAFMKNPVNTAMAHDLQREAAMLNNQRYLTIRAAAYNGRALILGDSSTVLPQNPPRGTEDMPSLHELLGLPDGTWRIYPNGVAVQVVTPRDKKTTPTSRTYGPHDVYARAA